VAWWGVAATRGCCCCWPALPHLPYPHQPPRCCVSCDACLRLLRLVGVDCRTASTAPSGCRWRCSATIILLRAASLKSLVVVHSSCVKGEQTAGGLLMNLRAMADQPRFNPVWTVSLVLYMPLMGRKACSWPMPPPALLQCCTGQLATAWCRTAALCVSHSLVEECRQPALGAVATTAMASSLCAFDLATLVAWERGCCLCCTAAGSPSLTQAFPAVAQ
jgi:hypothetical protein